MLIGFAGFLRRSEIIGLDIGRRDQTEDGRGWIEIFDMDMVVTLRGKTGRRELEIGQGSSDAARRVVALQNWLTLARIGHGPVFRRVKVKGKDVGPDRLADKHVARLVKQAALAAGVRADRPVGERANKLAGHLLQAGLASSAQMTPRYLRRRDRFRVNLTKAAGL